MENKYNVLYTNWIQVINCDSDSVFVSPMELLTNGDKYIKFTGETEDAISALKFMLGLCQGAIDGPNNKYDWLEMKETYQNVVISELTKYKDNFDFYSGKFYLNKKIEGGENIVPHNFQDLEFSKNSPQYTTHGNIGIKNFEDLIRFAVRIQSFSRGGKHSRQQYKIFDKNHYLYEPDGIYLHKSDSCDRTQCLLYGENILTTLWLNFNFKDDIVDFGRPVWKQDIIVFEDNNLISSYLSSIMPIRHILCCNEKDFKNIKSCVYTNNKTPLYYFHNKCPFSIYMGVKKDTTKNDYYIINYRENKFVKFGLFFEQLFFNKDTKHCANFNKVINAPELLTKSIGVNIYTFEADEKGGSFVSYGDSFLIYDPLFFSNDNGNFKYLQNYINIVFELKRKIKTLQESIIVYENYKSSKHTYYDDIIKKNKSRLYYNSLSTSVIWSKIFDNHRKIIKKCIDNNIEDVLKSANNILEDILSSSITFELDPKGYNLAKSYFKFKLNQQTKKGSDNE